ncbi:MAG TPA: hypothetical protein PLV25_00875 [Opitutales bacterium]|nr:hypothetical protein [Opitutales bacterium]
MIKTEAPSYLIESKRYWLVEQDFMPWITVDEVDFKDIRSLSQAHPELLKPENLPVYSRFANFLATGRAYCFIENPKAYHADYEAFLKSSETSEDEGFGNPESPAPPTPEFGPFNIEEIQAPRVQAGKLIFYAEDPYNHVPYRVEGAYPLSIEAPKLTYTPLPYA